MKTQSQSINDVLAINATSFFIPPFQRAYAWGKSEIERFYSDIKRIIDSELDENQKDKLEHFFGTLVITEEKSGFASKSVVVDGQQRLTTTLIFLIALRDLEENAENRNIITNTYLTNPSSSFQDKIKLKQVTKDWEAYRALINNKTPKQGIIYNAYQLFIKLITNTKRSKPNIKLEHYINAIRKMNVAVIFLDERPYKGEDPQIIFETLNSLGKPLTLSDLVRNYVLLNMKSDDQSNLYEKVWYPQIETVLPDNTSEFFRDYLQYKESHSVKVVSDNNTKEIYQLFKTFVEAKFANHKDFINDIVRYAKWYRWITTEVVNDTISKDVAKNQAIVELIRNIFHDIKAEAFKPFVLGLLEYHQSGVNGIKLGDDLFISILETIRTYLLRRRIIGLNQGENKNIVLLCSKIGALAKREVSMIDLLSNMFYRMRFPNNKEMGERLRTMNFYEQLRSYSKFILGKIEEHNAKVAVDFRNSKVTIEHIMPQKLDTQWEKELGKNHNEIHKKYLHNIGNLILTEFNSEIGNKPFSEKKQKLKASSLRYRLAVVDCDKWDEQSILAHQEKMINWLLGTFSLPSDYQETDNWKQNSEKSEDTKFSPLDDDATYMAKGNKPAELIIEGNTFKVESWQDVYLKFLQYIRESQNYDFDYIMDNQVDILNRNDVILKWSALAAMIEENVELINRYKTINGEFLDKAKDEDIKNDTLFVHINKSSFSIINNIANVMNKLYMTEESVTITLKPTPNIESLF